MSRLIGYFVFLGVVSLACATITQPISDAKNLAATAQAFATSIPDVKAYMDPQGTPVAEWNGIPIMTQASAGQEFNAKTYSFKAAATATEVQAFYKEKLTALGWSEPFNVPGGTTMAVMIFQKETSLLTISVTPSGDQVVVVLNLQ
jgi:hypothetical protein